MTDTPPPSPTDDDILEMMVQTYREGVPGRGFAAVLTHIRPLLEARGIEMAADKVAKTYGQKIAEELRFFARRHAEGGKNG